MVYVQDQFDQGYLILATGDRRYVEMAANLAATIRLLDENRRVCLVHDAPVPADLAPYFHDFSLLDQDARYGGVMNKLRVFDASPYAMTMFVDADCLLVKRDVDFFWERAALQPFSSTGVRQSSGVWKGVDVSTLMAAAGTPYVISFCSGVFTFDRSEVSANIFRDCNSLFLTRPVEFVCHELRGKSGQADEIYFGVVLAQHGIDCIHMSNVGITSWSVSTWRSVFCWADFLGRSVMFKANDFAWGKPYLPTKFSPLSPTFMHFVGLKPSWLYSRLSRKARNMLHCRDAERLAAL